MACTLGREGDGDHVSISELRVLLLRVYPNSRQSTIQSHTVVSISELRVLLLRDETVDAAESTS